MSKAHVTSLHHIPNVWQDMSGGIIWNHACAAWHEYRTSVSMLQVLFALFPLFCLCHALCKNLLYCRALKRQQAFVIGSMARPSRLFWVVTALENAA